ncbi:MAG: flagellar basal body rod protein FlgB [Ignavibacteriales bacterium CG_4_9_14_3_um_filter_34_10]|nr:MAG: flagellar basal body rod protein FlgB [Ignavibacteriales bacterium CG_4_9_14_3_um_filter_34_10]
MRKKLPNVKKLESYLNFLTTRNKVISENIANVGTKNYQRKDIAFKELLETEVNGLIKTSNSRHLGAANNDTESNLKFEVIVDKSSDNVSGVNNVDIEKEMAGLAENTINFKMTTRKLNNYYRTLREVIKGGGEG